MAHAQHVRPNGTPGRRESYLPAPSETGELDRPWSLAEVLPYAPFTSVQPFSADLLPTPSIGSAAPAPSLVDLISASDWESINQEVATEARPSKRVQQTAGQITSLLGKISSTEYKFKTGPMSGPRDAQPNPSLGNSLAPLSRMIYENVDVPFRYPSPDTPGAASPNGFSSNSIAPLPITVAHPAFGPKSSLSTEGAKGARDTTANAERLLPPVPVPTEFVEPGVPSPAVTVPLSSRSELAVQMPATHKTGMPNMISKGVLSQTTVSPVPCLVTPHESEVPILVSSAKSNQRSSQPRTASQEYQIKVELCVAASFNKSEYQVVTDVPDEPANLSTRKRKRDDIDGEAPYGEGLDQTQRAKAAFLALSNDLLNCFKAEDHAFASGSGNDWAKLTTEDEATLTSLAQAKVHTSLTKAISLSCYSEVPLNDLLRLMRLSGGALKASQSLELKLGEDWGPSDIERWVSQFDELENGMKAARTCLRLMCGGREDKQLYSEDIIERSIDLIRTVLDDMVIPVAEIRSSSQPTGIFKQVSCHKKRISAVLNDFQKLFSLMTILITKTDVSDSVSNALESMSSRLIFIETANSEKESVVETQKFDGLRSAAMDMLSQIFLLNPAQRHYIIGSVLTSLEKLPLGKQRARQFKTVGGPSIQPVSALLMRLVQASAGKYDDSKEVTRARTLQSLETAESIEGSTGEAARATAGLLYTVKDEEQAAARHSDAVAELKDTEERLTKEARTNAHHVSKFLVQRAQQATKTGDTPYRNLLDLFVEDFTSCLDNPDWPAAELLIRHLMILMNITLEDTKASAPAKNMALEILGVIGAAISTLRGNVRKTANGLETLDRDELGDYLCDLAVHALEPQAPREQVMSWSGPYRVALEYLQSRLGQNSHLASASSFLVTDWARQVCDVYDRGVPEAHDDQDAEYGKLAYRLREMILDQQWLLNEYEFRVVNPAQAKLAYSIVLLRSNVCEYYPQILTYLLNSMVSDQATVRSKSLKSINQVLETDPSILDGPSMLNQKSDKQGVIDRILHCLNDSSTQVRDSALGLIGRCLNLRPQLENHLISSLLDRFTDLGPGVRKRAMKLARDIYLRNQNKSIRSQIANGLLFRVLDPEESVRELARQLMEEIWFLPYYQAETTAEAQAAFAEHVVLLVQTAIQGGQNTGLVLDKVLSGVLSPSSKNAQSKANMEVCRKLVAGMVDLIGNPDSSDASVASGRDVLQVLTTFAKAEPTLFTYEQIRLLQPQVQSIGSISNSDELAPARAVVVIYRRVLPTLSSAHQEFFVEIRAQLTKVISAAPKPLLDDTMACLWTISTLVGTNENLQRLLQSSLARVQDLHQKVPKQNGRFVLDALQTRQFMRYCLLVGMIGKHCDLEAHLDTLKRNFPKRNFQTISQLMVDMFLPFCSSLQQLDVRKAALEAVGFVCQSWPRNYALPNVYTTMEDVFTRQNPALEMIVLKSFKEFFLVEEKRSEEPEEATAGAEPAKKEKKAKKRELTEMGGTNHDDVASATAVRFLRQITRVALATQDDVALLAVEVLGSINRQGLVHPKESCVTFITLETSSNPRIAELAYAQHVMLLTKHESVLEREYVKAFVSAFQYQRDVGGDAHGATQDPFQSKMHSFIDALKSSASKAKNRQKFLEKFVGQIDFDPVKLDVQEDIPHHVQYARFLVENLAFFDFASVGELHGLIACMEKLVTATGAVLAQAIEYEVQQIRMDAIDAPSTLAAMATDAQLEGAAATGPGDAAAADLPAPDTAPNVELSRLRQLASGSIILLSVWEARTFLRKLYGVKRDTASKAKTAAKDREKSAVKVQGVTGDRFWDEVERLVKSLSSRQAMVQVCGELVELMNVDKERQIAEEDEGGDEGEAGGDEEPATPEGGGDGDGEAEPSSTQRGRKRKASSTPGGVRKKKQRADSQPPPRKRGRPKKQSTEAAPSSTHAADADGEWDEDVF